VCRLCLAPDDGALSDSNEREAKEATADKTGRATISAAVILFILITIFGYFLCTTSFLGVMAVTKESHKLLKRHEILLCVWLVCAVMFGVAIQAVTLEELVSRNCYAFIETISSDTCKDLLNCHKYEGHGESWGRMQDGTFAWKNTSYGPAEIAFCTTKSTARFAWEVNPVTREDDVKVNYYGCLSGACCDRLHEMCDCTCCMITQWCFEPCSAAAPTPKN
jgi:hypothetical protein